MIARHHRNITAIIQASLLAFLAAAAWQAPAATISFHSVQGSDLIGRAPGPDGYWGTADDSTGNANFNNLGASSYSYDTAPAPAGYISFVTSTATIVPTNDPSTFRFTGLTVTPEYGSITYSLDTTAPDSTVTFTDAYHYTTNTYQTDGVGQYHIIGQYGYQIYNAPGMDDPSVVFAGAPNVAELTATFNLLKEDAPSTWTALGIEFGGYADSSGQVTNWPAVGTFTAVYTTDTSVIPSAVPIPPAFVLLATALMTLGLTGQRRAKIRS